MLDVNKIYKGYKFRIYPTDEQKTFFVKSFGCNRFVWNYYLDERKKFYLVHKNTKDEKRGLSYIDNCKDLTKLKKIEEFKWLDEVNSQSLQQELKHLDAAYLSFFKKQSGFPKFKTKNNKQSFKIPQNFKLENNKLWIPKLKTPIKIKQHLKFGKNAEVLHVVISKTKTDKYFVSFCVEENSPKSKKVKKKVGIDVGLTNFATFSNEEIIPNPKIAKKSHKKLKYLHRQLFKKRKDSKNRNKARLKLARCYDKITNCKKDFIHKLSRKIVNENQVIAVEDLNVTGMMKNRWLARPISEVSWSEFLRQLEYKSQWYGRNFVKIERFFPSSKLCPCGYINENLKLQDRKWQCPKCSKILDRDINAAKNILNQGLNILNSGEGLPSEPKQKLREAFAMEVVPKSTN